MKSKLSNLTKLFAIAVLSQLAPYTTSPAQTVSSKQPIEPNSSLERYYGSNTPATNTFWESVLQLELLNKGVINDSVSPASKKISEERIRLEEKVVSSRVDYSILVDRVYSDIDSLRDNVSSTANRFLKPAGMSLKLDYKKVRLKLYEQPRTKQQIDIRNPAEFLNSFDKKITAESKYGNNSGVYFTLTGSFDSLQQLVGFGR